MTTPRVTSDRVGNTQDQIASGGLIGIGVIVVTQLLALGVLDKALKVSLYCFVISIPLLSLYSLNLVVMSHNKYYSLTWYNLFSVGAGMLSALVGVGAVFWHFSRVACLIFAAL